MDIKDTTRDEANNILDSNKKAKAKKDKKHQHHKRHPENPPHWHLTIF